jgi:hypothetical protein
MGRGTPPWLLVPRAEHADDAVPHLVPAIGDRIGLQPLEDDEIDRGIYHGRDPNRSRVRENPLRGEARRVFAMAFGVLAAIVVVACAAVMLSSCSGSAVDTQSRVVSGIGIAANAGEPRWIAAYRAEGIAAADHACPAANLPAQSCVDARVAAGRVVTEHWSHVRDAWEINAHAQGAYADALDACAALDAGTCPALTAAAAALDGTIGAFRCAVRAIGHPEVDPLPPPAPLCGTSSPSPGGSQ